MFFKIFNNSYLFLSLSDALLNGHQLDQITFLSITCEDIISMSQQNYHICILMIYLKHLETNNNKKFIILRKHL